MLVAMMRIGAVLRIIVIAAHKYYVLDAPLGDRTIAGADADVMNV